MVEVTAVPVGGRTGQRADIQVHFETRSDKPSVFLMTETQIAEAKVRANVTLPTTLGHDLADLSWLSRADVLVTSNDVLCAPAFPLRRLVDVAPQLRWIHIIGAGIEPLLPLDWLPKGCVLTNNSGVHAEKAAESGAMVLLMLNARLPAIATNQRHSRWDQIFTGTIRGKTALIVGAGDMGTAVASAARRLGLHVIGTRRNPAAHPDYDRMVAADRLDEVLPEADFVVLATPLTPETRNLMDRRRFGLMKPGAGFFNFGRAGSVDHVALAEVLRSGHLSGAIIDVVPAEPLESSSPLWQIENLMVIPHVTSDDLNEYMPKTYDLVFQNLERLRNGQPLLNTVDPARGY